MAIEFIFDPELGFYQKLGSVGKSDFVGKINASSGMSVKRNVTFQTSLEKGVAETSGSLLQLKGKQEGIHFHVGGNQYISNNCWFDGSHPESAFGRWVYESTSGAAFRWGFLASSGQFELDWAKSGIAGQVITGSKNSVWGTGLSMTASNGAIGIGKRAFKGLNATLDITGSNSLALAVTGSVDIGGGAPDSYFILPRLTNDQRNALNAVNGMMIYNTTDDKFQGFQAGSWQNLI